jgi:hypothetical protein
MISVYCNVYRMVPTWSKTTARASFACCTRNDFQAFSVRRCFSTCAIRLYSRLRSTSPPSMMHRYSPRLASHSPEEQKRYPLVPLPLLSIFPPLFLLLFSFSSPLSLHFLPPSPPSGPRHGSAPRLCARGKFDEGSILQVNTYFSDGQCIRPRHAAKHKSTVHLGYRGTLLCLTHLDVQLVTAIHVLATSKACQSQNQG